MLCGWRGGVRDGSLNEFLVGDRHRREASKQALLSSFTRLGQFDFVEILKASK